MADLTIEREIEIDAPVDVVWRTITEPDQIVRWFADEVELEAVPGGEGVLSFKTGEGATRLAAPLQVEAMEPPTRFTFRWSHPAGEQPVVGNSVLVEFTLVARGPERTHLRVVEYGLELLGWSEADKATYASEHREGWAFHLGRLGALLGHP